MPTFQYVGFSESPLLWHIIIYVSVMVPCISVCLFVKKPITVTYFTAIYVSVTAPTLQCAVRKSVHCAKFKDMYVILPAIPYVLCRVLFTGHRFLICCILLCQNTDLLLLYLHAIWLRGAFWTSRMNWKVCYTDWLSELKHFFSWNFAKILFSWNLAILF